MTTRHGFTVEILEFAEIHSLPGRWTSDRYRELLDLFDYDEIASISEPDLVEMAAMAAQDEGLKDAADRVLACVFGEAMSSGVRQNLIDDLTGDRPWELFADLEHQAGIFEAVEFLQRAFPSEFGIPDAARVRIRLTATGKHAAQWLRDGPKASLLVRLLASAMDARATLWRLYSDSLESLPFPAADAIIWSAVRREDQLANDPASCVLEVYSSLQWLDALRDVRGEFASDAEPDE
jgi:hypothetical protein